MSSSGTRANVLLNQLTVLQNSALLCAGLWLHELITHLRYDWELVRRPEAGRSATAHLAKWIYLACRTFSFVHCTCVVVVTFPEPRDCQIAMKVLTASGFLGVVCASALLSIRVAAVWLWDKRIVSLLVLISLVTLALSIYLLVEINSTYDSATLACVLNGIYSALVPSVALLIGDCTILTLLLTGLRRNFWHDTRHFRTWRILWTQGLVYLFLAAVAEVPLVILLILNLSPILNTMFLTPEVILLAVCATRMFRSLNTGVRGESGERFTNGVSHGRVTAVRGNGIQLAPIRGSSSLRQGGM